MLFPRRYTSCVRIQNKFNIPEKDSLDPLTCTSFHYLLYTWRRRRIRHIDKYYMYPEKPKAVVLHGAERSWKIINKHILLSLIFYKDISFIIKEIYLYVFVIFHPDELNFIINRANRITGLLIAWNISTVLYSGKNATNLAFIERQML